MFELTKLKTQLLLQPNMAFYCSVMLQLKCYEDKTIETACTDGVSMRFNPDFMTQHDEQEQLGVLVHEILHVAFFDMERGKFLDKRRFNAAADYRINDFAVNRLKLKLPKDCLLDAKYPYSLSAEQIYDLLPNEDIDPDFDDLMEPEEGNSPGEAATTLQGVIQQAVMEAEIQGQTDSIPGAIRRRVEELSNPLVRWEDQLAQYATVKIDSGYTFAVRDVFFADAYVPGQEDNGIGTLSIYIDLSGSVSDPDLVQYVSEVRDILDVLNPELTRIISFSHFISNIQEIERDEIEDCEIELGESGGTDLSEVAIMVNERDDDVSLVITDGHYTPVTYNKPVLHLIVNHEQYTNNDHEVIHIKI